VKLGVQEGLPLSYTGILLLWLPGAEDAEHLLSGQALAWDKWCWRCQAAVSVPAASDHHHLLLLFQTLLLLWLLELLPLPCGRRDSLEGPAAACRCCFSCTRRFLFSW